MQPTLFKIVISFCILILCGQNLAHSSYLFFQSKTKSQANKKVLPEEYKKYRVIGIKDGDTIVLLVDGKEITVRLSHIDCPEKKQDYGTKAKEFTSQQVFGKYVWVKHGNKTDRNGRVLGEIYFGKGESLNKKLVQNGLAWHYKEYSKDLEYERMENQARKNKINIWSKTNPTPPWTFRKERKKR